MNQRILRTAAAIASFAVAVPVATAAAGNSNRANLDAWAVPQR